MNNIILKYLNQEEQSGVKTNGGGLGTKDIERLKSLILDRGFESMELEEGEAYFKLYNNFSELIKDIKLLKSQGFVKDGKKITYIDASDGNTMIFLKNTSVNPIALTLHNRGARIVITLR